MKDGSKTNLPIDFKLKDDTYKNLGEVTYEYHVQGTKLGGEVKYKLPESGEYEELVKSKATFDTALYKTKLDLSALGDSSFPVVNDGKTTETDLTKLKEYNPNSRVVYDSTALNKRLDIEMARLVTNGVYTVDPNSIKVVDFSDRQNDLKEREKQLGDIFTVNSTSKRDVSEPTTVETTESDNWWESVEPTAGADVTDSSDDAWWKHVESETESTTDNVTEAEETVIEAVTETTEEIDATKKDDTDVVDAGNVIDKKLESDENKIDEGDSIELNSTNYYVYADSAEEEYLALSFINQEDMIRIDIFPSLMDTDILSDVINKVYYQNPYFLGAVSLSVGMDEAGAVYLLPEYKYSKEDALSMQKEIYSTATNVLGSIIRANMSDEEKLEAIWNYLDDNTVYDYAACDNAVANDFHASLDYADSFNTYGILVKRVGVCQSYAYTMDLLLSMSGVDCITLTGYSNKTMPHAWNAVNLGGKYYWVDATANYDYTCIPYFLYTTSSDYAMDNGYSLDNGYLLDNELSIVYNSDENKDWYYVHNRVVKSDADLVQAIAEGWDEATKITYAIRLDYDLNITDDLVSAIVNELYSAGVSKTDLVNNFDLYTCGNYVIVTKDREAFESKLSQS
jgi:hypothetical protein